jgi:alkylation response protein AidB-like acyl-CoA dehydrogenase
MAIQMFGGAGVCSDYPVASFNAMGRLLRIADGPDEVHLGMVSRLELKKYIQR